MNILLSESNHDERISMSTHLQRWGYCVYELESEASILTRLKKSTDIQLLILGDLAFDLENLVKEVRKLERYVYILHVGSKENSTVYHENLNLDKVWSKPIDPVKLRVHIYGIFQIIDFSLNYSLSPRIAQGKSRRQILNLVHLNRSFSQDRKAALKALKQFLIELERVHLTRDSAQNNIFEDLLVNAETFGCDQLTDWLVGKLYLKSNPELAKMISYPLLQYHFKELIRDLSEGISNLSDFGFFKDSSKDSQKVSLVGKRVLLVEDMKYNRVLLNKILTKQQCQIVEAMNGEDAIAKWQESSGFDVIIMDMNMPVMDGFTATKKIRELEKAQSLKRTPIIALTALAMRGDKELCLEAGTDDYLPKPVEALSLIKTCERLLAGNQMKSPKPFDEVYDLRVKKVLLKSDNQIAIFVMETVLKDLRIEYEVFDETRKVLAAIAERDFNLVVLDAESDLELAYFIKESFPHQYITLICSPGRMKPFVSTSVANSFTFPFQHHQIFAVLRYYSDKLLQAEKEAEKLADVDSLNKIKGQAGINEAVQKSCQQLAVWQKAFRKIGGDLVLSHQFNLHGKFGLILGDVAGHDIQSGYTASWFSGLVEGIWGQNSNPFKFLVNLNNLFAHDTEEENKRFVCALVLLWDPIRERLSFANAGIPGGILIRKDTGKAEYMDWTGVPIGMFPDMDMYDHGEIDYKAGDRLIVATDGVLEAIPREIVSGLSEAKSDQTAQHTLDAIVDFVTRSIEINDDLTIAVFEAKVPPIPSAGFRKTIRSDFKEVDEIVDEMEALVEEKVSDLFEWPMISVAIREALINAVEHGNHSAVELPVDIDFSVDQEKILVIISDCGSGFDLSAEKKRLQLEGDLRIHGRGIEMMENISRSVQFLGGGIHLEFSPKSDKEKVEHST